MVGATLQWIKQDSSFNTSSAESAPMSVCDESYVYTVYTTSGTVTGSSATGSTDIVVLKTDLTGNVIWIKQSSAFNTSSFNIFPSIATYGGNVYVAYHSNGTASGGSSSGGADIIVFKLDSSGSVSWIKQMSSFNTSSDDNYPSICCDSSGVFVSYQTTGTISGGSKTAQDQTIHFGPGPPITIPGNDIVVFKLSSSDGSLSWSKQDSTINTVGTNTNSQLCLDSTHLYLTYTGAGALSGKTLTGSTDIIIICMNPGNGSVIWAKQESSYNSSGLNNAPQIVASISVGGIYVAFDTNGTVPGGSSSGSTDIAVLQMTSGGSLSWIVQSDYNTNKADLLQKIACDASGVYVLYNQQNSVSMGVNSVIVFKLNPSGSRIWTFVDSSFTMNGLSGGICVNNTGLFCSFITNGTMAGGTNSGLTDLVLLELLDSSFGAPTNNSCFSYETLKKILNNISSKKDVLIFGGKRGDKKMYRCEIEDFGTCEFTHDHLFLYNNMVVPFEELLLEKNLVKNIVEINIDEIDTVYNIIGDIEQLSDRNLFKINDKISTYGGRVKSESKVEYVEKILLD